MDIVQIQYGDFKIPNFRLKKAGFRMAEPISRSRNGVFELADSKWRVQDGEF